jgi:DNA-binding MarR family transcriptional regulator
MRGEIVAAINTKHYHDRYRTTKDPSHIDRLQMTTLATMVTSAEKAAPSGDASKAAPSGGPSNATLAAPPLPSSHSVVLIARLARTVRSRLQAALAPLGLRYRHLVALSYLRDHGPTPQQALGDGLRIDPSNLVGLLNALDDQGLVVRRRDPADRRRHIVELSAQGRQLLDEDVQRTLAEVDDDVLGSLPADDRAALHRILMRVTGDLAALCLSDDEEPCAP